MDFQWFDKVSWDSIKDAAPRTSSHRHGSSLLCNKLSMPSYVPSHIMVPPRWHLNQHGRFLCSAAGSSWAVLRSTLQRATARISWKPDLTSSGPSGPWFVPNVTLHLFSAPHANLPNKNSHVSASHPAPIERGRAVTATRNAPPVPVTRDQESDPAVPVQTTVSNLFLAEVADLVPKHTPTNAATQ